MSSSRRSSATRISGRRSGSCRRRFGDGDRLTGHITATFTARGSGETFLLNQLELYEVRDGAISKIEVFQHDTPALIDFFDKNGPAS